MAWLDHRRKEPGTTTFRELAADAADEELAREAAKLDNALFVRNQTRGPWSGQRFADRVGARRRRKASGTAAASNDLAPLNPRAGQS